ncbi:MAG: YkgJ family cysteine cluster protein [Gammaproteobacteria bacterium]|nr:YkgJ family cysteine cluster protein [Gammaproteobacteria bacterium]
MSDLMRQPQHVYRDPLAEIWIHCAERIGFKVVRSKEAYASTDGRGTLLIATDEDLDPDDHLGQMIFHELCHALVEGDEGEGRVDWGLDNTRMGHPWREHAALRLQAYLAERWGLRDFMAPTTDFRVTFWAGLPQDPFEGFIDAGGHLEKSVIAAKKAFYRAEGPRFKAPLEDALKATALIGTLIRGALSPSFQGSDPSRGLRPLWETVKDPLPLHPLGHEGVKDPLADKTCEGCTWHFFSRGHLRCRHQPRAKLAPLSPACRRFESQETLDCKTCGACCREAFDSVEISRRDPFHRTHPEWVEILETHHKLKRSGGRCIALEGGPGPEDPYRCRIYPERPKTCRDFSLGGSNCLEARRRVGLSV